MKFEAYSEPDSDTIEKTKQDIKDIFIEESDANFSIGIYFSTRIAVEIEHNITDWFKLTEELYGQIQYLIDYMSDKFPDLTFSFVGERLGAPKGDLYVKKTDLENYIDLTFANIILAFE
jgi:hypothetical protein